MSAPQVDAPRLIIGNLDAEADFVAATGRPRLGLSKAAAEVATAAATLLRVFARPGDVLALPSRIDERRITAVDGLPRPRIVTVRDVKPGALLAWAETPAVASLRPAPSPKSSLPKPPSPRPAIADATIHDAAWHWPVPSPDASRRANDRQLAWQLARELGCALPGDRLVRTRDEWRRAVATIDGPWVAKACFAAAGRWRIWGDALPDEAIASRVARLLARHGVIRVEPWCARVRDVGVVALATASGTKILGAHGLLVDSHGRFEGIEVRVCDAESEVSLAASTQLSAPRCARLAAVVEAVGQGLQREGYGGPFGIDAWLWQPADRDEVRLHPLGEINARMTFGLVAHAWVARLRDPLGLRAGDRVTLRFSSAPMPAGALSLLDPGDGGLAIWLEIERV